MLLLLKHMANLNIVDKYNIVAKRSKTHSEVKYIKQQLKLTEHTKAKN